MLLKKISVKLLADPVDQHPKGEIAKVAVRPFFTR